jgi:hypothetical protein
MSSSSNPHRDSAGFTVYDYEPSPNGCVIIYKNTSNFEGLADFSRSCSDNNGERFGCAMYTAFNFNTTAEYDIWNAKHGQTFSNVTETRCENNSAEVVLFWCRATEPTGYNRTPPRSRATKRTSNVNLSIKVFNSLQLIMFIVLLSTFTF